MNQAEIGSIEFPQIPPVLMSARLARAVRSDMLLQE